MNDTETALIILVVAISFCTLCGVALLFEAFRLKKASDALQRAGETATSLSSNAMSVATQALTVAQSLQVQHFDTLSAKVAGLAGSVASLQAETSSFSEGLRNVSNKFEARVRREEKETKAASSPSAVGNEPVQGYYPVEYPVPNGRGGHLKPLPKSFGVIANGG